MILDNKRKPHICQAKNIRCDRCGKSKPLTEFYKSNSMAHATYGKIPYCKDCIVEMYAEYAEDLNDSYGNVGSKKACERVCMLFDMYWSEDVFNDAVRLYNAKSEEIEFAIAFVRAARQPKYSTKDYNETIKERIEAPQADERPISGVSEDDDEGIIVEATKIFGEGYKRDEYKYLYNEYSEWVTRNECDTKAQEDIFRRLSLNAMMSWRLSREGKDTKNVDAAFQSLLDSAKLQPKQEGSESIAAEETYGMWIDKVENEEPIPEPDDDFKDVDNVNNIVNFFLKGHLAKMLGLKSAYIDGYEEYMAQYTVNKPVYEADDGGTLYNEIFGKTEEEEYDGTA